MQALLTTPGRAGTTRIGAVPAPAAGGAASAAGVPSARSRSACAGPIARSPRARSAWQPAALHGFAREVVVEDPAQLVRVPASLGRLGVLAEPASVCVRGIRHVRTIGARQTWRPRRALVIGAGAIGMLATYLLRLDRGLEVWTAARDAAGTPRAALVAAAGARYVATGAVPLAVLRDDVGGFDLVVEAAGDAQVMLDVLGLLRRNGIGCLLGLDARRRPVSIGGPVAGVDAVLENRVLVGSVNARAEDWRAAVAALDEIRRERPDALEAMVGLRGPPDRFADAFAFTGVKATLVFDGRDDACAPSR